MKKTIKKKSLLGASYTVVNEVNSGKEILYVFKEAIDFEIISEETTGSPKGFGDCLILDKSEMTLLRTQFERPEIQVRNLFQIAPEKEKDDLDFIKRLKAVVIPIDYSLISDEAWLDYVIQIAERFQTRLVFACNEGIEEMGVPYKKFRLRYPDMNVKRIIMDEKEYLSKLWKTTFGMLPSFDPEVIIQRLRSYMKLDTKSIKSFVMYLANHTEAEDRIPTEDEINEFFDINKNKTWKEQLSDLVAMDKAKQEIVELINEQIYLAALKKHRKFEDYMPVRAVISGNPGVGKSTLLQIVEQAFFEEGFIKKGASYISCRSLIADHIGGSEERLRKITENCDLLILDELGGLTIDGKFDAGIVQQLVYLTERRRDLHIFFIGYEKDVANFLKLNPGLRSRIQNYITIPDYTKRELVNIGISMLQKYQYEFDETMVTDILEKFVEQVVEIRDYGNARAMRVLMDHLNMIKGTKYAETKILDMKVTREQMEKAVKRYFHNQVSEGRMNLIGFAS